MFYFSHVPLLKCEKMISKFLSLRYKKNEQPKEFHNILIVGRGYNAQRVIFDAISEALLKKIEKLYISAESIFIKEDEDETINFTEKLKNQTLNKPYESVLLISADQTNVNIINDNVMISTEGNPYKGIISSSNTRATSKIVFSWYDIKNMKVEIWLAKMFIDLDVSNNNSYNRIADKLIQSFINNHLCK